MVVLARTRLVAESRNFGRVDYSGQLVGGVSRFHNDIDAVCGLESEPQAERSWAAWVSHGAILQELLPPLFWGGIRCTEIFSRCIVQGPTSVVHRVPNDGIDHRLLFVHRAGKRSEATGLRVTV